MKSGFGRSDGYLGAIVVVAVLLISGSGDLIPG
jgi:hypothetical protein